ncbi:NAD(P)H-dependent flavin oxidoreductase [Tumebacillus lipolyticus]|uniref:Probable nitronate monooxygenase n=1 Tax=Tumebacillus lipolyticus TaxID=1280370 RepID=A0ABW5A1H8_9BACL
MWTQTSVTQALHLEVPILQAGMAGGSTTPELIAAVSNAGGLGTLGAGYMTPEQMRGAIRAIRQLTDRPFAVNLFVNQIPTPDTEQVATIQNIMSKHRQELGIPEPQLPSKYAEAYQDQLRVVIEENVPVFSFTFGIPSREEMDALKQRGIVTCGTATTVREAIVLEEHGVDLIVGQGSEGGGHRGTFLSSAEQALIGTMALIPQIVDRVSVPVIAAGGIMDGRGIAAALSLGADAVQLGTAFLTCSESGAHAQFKEAVRNSTDESTALTRAFSGKYARGIRNTFLSELAAHDADIPEYPIQNALTRDIRQAAAQQNNPAYMSLWAGQAAALSQSIGASDLMRKLVAQTNEAMRRFS